MGKKKKTPAPPVYVQPQPVQPLLPGPQEEQYLQEKQNELKNFNSLYNPYFKEQESLFKKDLTQNVNEMYEPMAREVLNNSVKRFGGLNNSIYRDMQNEIEKDKTDALTKAMEDYKFSELDRKMQAEKHLQDMINVVRNRTSQAYNMGFGYSNSLNSFNLNNYQNQLENAANNQSFWDRYLNFVRGNQGIAATVMTGNPDYAMASPQYYGEAFS